ncbi:hypothetical protein SAMN05880582_10940 [Rhizobium sp. RU20A]|uniref:hypothetical protein n=1 Tax=Rhizobium sp. RU20A TaxID=1907412 RepID=UPI0009560C0B|nr:hypothetical protein [Rhizobium sp. RU20A]SIR27179.1 hypothetical protein SAMN05880582_10940 [Rhizobium sp. RU20A]
MGACMLGRFVALATAIQKAADAPDSKLAAGLVAAAHLDMAQSARSFALTFGVPEETVRAELLRIAGPHAHLVLEGTGSADAEARFVLTARGEALIAAAAGAAAITAPLTRS